jgi:hypothetical protein
MKGQIPSPKPQRILQTENSTKPHLPISSTLSRINSPGFERKVFISVRAVYYGKSIKEGSEETDKYKNVLGISYRTIATFQPLFILHALPAEREAP